MTGYFPYPLEDLPTLGMPARHVPGRLGSLAVYRSREDTPVRTVFLHGVGLDSSAWSPVVRAAEARNVPTDAWAFIDVPGFGGSARLENSVSLDDVAGAVCDALDGMGATEAVHLVGHSMGGFLALHVAARHPDRIRSLTTVCGAYSTVVAAVNRPGPTLVRAPLATLTYGAISLVARLGRVGTLVLGLGARTGLLRLSLFGLAAHPRQVPDSLLAGLADDNRPESFLFAENTGDGYDCEAVWSTVGPPVLAVFGEKDVLVAGRDRRTLARGIPHARIEVVPDTAHLVPMERPNELFDVIRDRLADDGDGP